MPAYVGLPNTHSVGLKPGYHGAAYLGAGLQPLLGRRRPELDRATACPSLTLRRPASTAARLGRPPRPAARLRRRPPATSTPSGLMDGLDRFTQRGVRPRDRPRGPRGVRPPPRTRGSATVTAGTSGARAPCWPAGWSRPASGSSRSPSAAGTSIRASKRACNAVLPVLDHAVGTLVDDLDQRGLLDSTLVIVMGEFGRTPRINKGLPNDPTPGRDHWGEVMSVLVAGGGLRRAWSSAPRTPAARCPTSLR